MMRVWNPGSSPDVVASILGDVADLPAYRRALMEEHVWAVTRYAPSPWPGRVAVFRTSVASLLRAHEHDLGWSRLATQGVEVYTIAGAHYNILQHPHVSSLSAKLTAALQKARSQYDSAGADNPDTAAPTRRARGEPAQSQLIAQ